MTATVAPLISVITVVKNSVTSIAQCIDSVLEQDMPSFEHIIIDGASDDGTLSLIQNMLHDRLRWISEPDNGLYEAMNKGIAMCRGQWLFFLGADDVLVDSKVLSDIFVGQDLSSFDMIYGRSLYTNGRENTPRLDWRTLIFNTVHHQAAFYNFRLFSGFRYRTDIPVVADYELNFLIYSRKQATLKSDRLFSKCGDMGISHRANHFMAQLNTARVRARYLSLPFNASLLLIGLFNVTLMKSQMFLRKFV